MPFRFDESAQSGYKKMKTYLIPRSLPQTQRERSEKVLDQIRHECGPPVDAYPSWHPLIRHVDEPSAAETSPSVRCGYRGLDHTRYFENGFITCPYENSEDVIQSAMSLPYVPGATISAQCLDVPFYDEHAAPVLVKCHWDGGLEPDGTIPKRMAVPLMLEKELPCWRYAQVAETWETMRPYVLGQPHGSLSSHFVNQDTALALKRIYVSMIESGMFGPPKARAN